MCTVFLQVLAAEIHRPGHLSVNRVKAELFVTALLPVASCLFWQGQLEGLQEPRLVIIKVSDAIHRHSTLSSRRVTTTLSVTVASHRTQRLGFNGRITHPVSDYPKVTNSQRILMCQRNRTDQVYWQTTSLPFCESAGLRLSYSEGAVQSGSQRWS